MPVWAGTEAGRGWVALALATAKHGHCRFCATSEDDPRHAVGIGALEQAGHLRKHAPPPA